MRLLTFQTLAVPRLGIKTSRGIIDVAAAAADSTIKTALNDAVIPETMEVLYNTGSKQPRRLRELASNFGCL